jgi:hypothetical protein
LLVLVKEVEEVIVTEIAIMVAVIVLVVMAEEEQTDLMVIEGAIEIETESDLIEAVDEIETEKEKESEVTPETRKLTIVPRKAERRLAIRSAREPVKDVTVPEIVSQ